MVYSQHVMLAPMWTQDYHVICVQQEAQSKMLFFIIIIFSALPFIILHPCKRKQVFDIMWVMTCAEFTIFTINQRV